MAMIKLSLSAHPASAPLAAGMMLSARMTAIAVVLNICCLEWSSAHRVGFLASPYSLSSDALLPNNDSIDPHKMRKTGLQPI